MGAYATTHDADAAAQHFFKQLGHSVKESTVKLIRNAYKDARKKSHRQFYGCSLPEKREGHTLLLGESIDKRLQLYLKAIRTNGGPVTAGIAIAAARGLLLVENKSKLFEYRGHIKLNRSWAYALFNRMGMIQRKPTT